MDEQFRKHVEAAEELAAQVLGPYEARPPREDINLVVGELIRLGLPLATKITSVSGGDRSPRAEGALHDWTYFTAKGPRGQSDHAAWNYVRGLARVVRSLVGAIREDQPASVV